MNKFDRLSQEEKDLLLTDMYEALVEIINAFTTGYALMHPTSKAALAKASAALAKVQP